MKTIRTTITLPIELHHNLRAQAFRYHKSFNEIAIMKLQEGPEKKYTTYSKEERIQDDITFFKKVAKMGRQIDPVKAVREERDRDEANNSN